MKEKTKHLMKELHVELLLTKCWNSQKGPTDRPVVDGPVDRNMAERKKKVDVS